MSDEIDYDYVYHPESISGNDEVPDEEDNRCMDCGAPAAYFCQDCGDFLCRICNASHEDQHQKECDFDLIMNGGF